MTIGDFWTIVTNLCNLFDGYVHGGPRCWKRNKELKGAETSLHPAGLAADIDFYTPAQMKKAAKYAKRLRLFVIKKKTTIHVQPLDNSYR